MAQKKHICLCATRPGRSIVFPGHYPQVTVNSFIVSVTTSQYSPFPHSTLLAEATMQGGTCWSGQCPVIHKLADNARASGSNVGFSLLPRWPRTKMRTRVCGLDISHTLIPTHRDLRLDMDFQSDTCQQSLFESGELTVIPSLPFTACSHRRWRVLQQHNTS